MLYDYFWFCDFAPLVFLVFFLFGNIQAIKGFISILLFGQLGYIAIIFTKVLFGVTVMNFSFDHPLTFTYITYTILIHLATLVAFAATYRYPPTRIALLYSLLILGVTYGVIKVFVVPTGTDVTNYNLIFHSHILEHFKYYSQFWVLIAFVCVVLPTHLFQYYVARMVSMQQVASRDLDSNLNRNI